MIYICNLQDMPDHAAALAPSHLLSLLPPGEHPPTPELIGAGRHHNVAIHDIDQPLDGLVLPGPEHVEPMIAFLRAWQPQEGALLIHCFAGISRSTAAALIALAVKAPGREAAAARHLRGQAAHARPNRRMIEVADDLLGCEGRLVAALDRMGEAELASWGGLVRLTLV